MITAKRTKLKTVEGISIVWAGLILATAFGVVGVDYLWDWSVDLNPLTRIVSFLWFMTITAKMLHTLIHKLREIK